MQKLTKFKVIFDLFTVSVYFIQQQNCKLYYIYLMIISEIQSEIGHCSCDSAKFKAPADFSHHAILFYDIVLKQKFSQKFFVFCLFFCFVFYFIKISKFPLPGVMLMYERTSKDRKKVYKLLCSIKILKQVEERFLFIDIL